MEGDSLPETNATAATAVYDDVLITCDYLVVGAGTSGMSFVDTLLTHDGAATVVLVDRYSQPGGHWNFCYEFVRLHQPSCYYGVNSLRLGRTIRNGREVFDRKDRASGAEVVEYFGRVLQQFRSSGRVKCMFGTEYVGKEGAGGYHTVVTTATNTRYRIQCGKIVTLTTSVVVPSMRAPTIPVHNEVAFVPINDVPKGVQSGSYQTYIVIGAGKSGTDAILELLRLGVDPTAITWIISRDAWYVLRDGMFAHEDNYWLDMARMLRCMVDADSAETMSLLMEKEGIIGRLQPDGPNPPMFRSAAIEKDELLELRKIRNTVRRGRVIGIEKNKIAFAESSIPLNTKDTLVVDCMVDKLYGYLDLAEGFKFFEPGRVQMGPLLFFFNIAMSASFIAYLEATFNNDAVKNSFCFHLGTRHYSKATPETHLLGFTYAQLKQQVNFLRYYPTLQFVLGARTNQNAVDHHGGWWNLIWATVGPIGIKRLRQQLIRKVESGEFAGVTDSFGVEQDVTATISQKQISASLRRKTRSNYPPKPSKKGAMGLRSGWKTTSLSSAVIVWVMALLALAFSMMRLNVCLTTI